MTGKESLSFHSVTVNQRIYLNGFAYYTRDSDIILTDFSYHNLSYRYTGGTGSRFEFLTLRITQLVFDADVSFVVDLVLFCSVVDSDSDFDSFRCLFGCCSRF